MIKYKELELIFSSFKCDKNCPYCTAKITKWPIKDDSLDKLLEKLNFLKDKKIRFKYFIISGNGEPSLNSYDSLKMIKDATNKVNLFDEKRLQSSGNIFYEDDKFEMLKDDFMIEITRCYFDSKKDMEILGYERDYINTDNFKKAKIRLNYVMMKNKTFDEYLDEIKMFIDKYPNIKTVSLKTLNVNTLNDNIDNRYSKWILENGLTKSDSDKIIDYMANKAIFKCKDENFFDRYEWIYHDIPITFYVKKLDYGYSNIVYYGGELVDYHLKPINFEEM